MAHSIDFTITDEGLVFEADAEMRQEIQELYEKFENPDERHYNWYSLAGDVFEYATCNGLSWVDPADIGALTEAPIFSDSSIQDDGTFPEDANVWWFPNYMVEDCIETLMKTGRVVFQKGT